MNIGYSLVGAGVGAGLMFLLDPARGNRRRALIRDKMVYGARKTRDAAEATRRDVGNRLYGMTAEVRNRFSPDEADDRVIGERVRAELGRIASHPGAITVLSSGCVVTLTGDVLAGEEPRILSVVRSVRGVSDVCNELTVHPSADGVPSLQGESERPDQWTTWLRSGWSPAAMVACAAATATTILAAMRGVASRRNRALA